MSCLFFRIVEHMGHTYGEQNAAIECVDCGCVIVDENLETEEVQS